ncbi:DsbA family protein [Aerococcaceae bacterium DSM 111021]|nr:DsbA family protein [Aerococcaceae bacterium DSM 111021]
MSQYQIEYRHNGVSNVFEFFLFVNPLGHTCYTCEQEVLKLIDLVASNIDLHILPFHNQHLVENFMRQLGISDTSLKERNYIFQAVYRASLAYKAACMQGKRLGRYYLMRLQESIDGDVSKFNSDFAVQLAKEVGLDVEIFKQDMQSDFVKQLFLKDQKTAIDMSVHSSPSLVIYEYVSGEARLIDNQQITLESILDEIDALICDGNEQQAVNTNVPSLRLL